jgi:succinoglycan biosynthesis transport protein ExoP
MTNPIAIERLSMVVGIATAGRPEILGKAIKFLAHQSRLPDRLLICPMAPSDVDEVALEHFPAPGFVVDRANGLTAQRNKILSEVGNADVIIFFDDDFFAHFDYLSNVEKLFLARPDVVAATGTLFADGAVGPGLNAEEGSRIVRTHSIKESDDEQIVEYYGTYGCNMAFRLDPIRLNNIIFDENLPLYSWMEDVDFSHQMSHYGRIVKSKNLRGVHLGIKLGRTSGVRFGYSQIANPIYLTRKGTMSRKHARTIISRNVGANLIRSLYPERWIDRRGRLKGNVLAVIDLAVGRLSPHRILQLD